MRPHGTLGRTLSVGRPRRPISFASVSVLKQLRSQQAGSAPPFLIPMTSPVCSLVKGILIFFVTQGGQKKGSWSDDCLHAFSWLWCT